jgi:RNA polymerase sigma-70 factor (sigma-E family)
VDAVREAEFRDFVVGRTPSLLGTAYLLTGDRAAAEDLLQASLTKAWAAWRRVSAADSPEAYVRRVMANTYASWWRRRWHGERPTEVLPERVDGGDPTAAVDDRDALWRALGGLPRKQRAVLVLRYFEELSEAETAKVLGVSVGTVKSQASRALAKLRDDAALGAGRVGALGDER